jgi:hypothetical protein
VQKATDAFCIKKIKGVCKMKGIISWFGGGLLSICLGLSNKFVLAGTNSSQALILAGAALIIVGYILLLCSSVEYPQKPTAKKKIGWRIALVTVFGLFTLYGLFMVIGFSVATLLRGETIGEDMVTGTIVGCVMCIPLAPSIFSLKKAMRGNKELRDAKGN